MTDVNVPQGFVPFDEIPDSGVLLDGTYQVTIEEIENEPSSTGKKMYSARMVVDEPTDFLGQYVFENFVIGNDADPTASKLSTWKSSIGSKRWKQLCKAAGIPAETDEAKLLASAIGAKLMISVTMFTEKKGDYAGTVRNRIGAFHRVGERKPEITAPAAGKPLMQTPVIPTAPAPAPPVAPAVPAAPVAAPVAPAAPVQPAAPVPPQPAAQAPGELPCGICGASVPIPQFQAHIAECMSAANTAA